jgi:spore germination protein KB
MNKEIISQRQGIIIMILFIFGSTLALGTGSEAKNDAWIAIILGIVFSVPVMLMYSRLLSAYPGKDIFDILNIVFGKFLGRAICILYIWFPFHLGALVIRNFGEFINAVALPETPKIVPMIILAGLSAWVAKQGIDTLSRCAGFFVIIVIFAHCRAN